MEAPLGWICPRCKKSNAPHVDSCSCSKLAYGGVIPNNKIGSTTPTTQAVTQNPTAYSIDWSYDWLPPKWTIEGTQTPEGEQDPVVYGLNVIGVADKQKMGVHFRSGAVLKNVDIIAVPVYDSKGELLLAPADWEDDHD